MPKVSKMTHNLDMPKVSKMTHNLDLPKVSKMSSLRQSALKSSHLRSNHSAVPKTNNYKNFFLLFIVQKMLDLSLKDLNPSLEELKEIAKLLTKKTCL